MTLLNDPKPLTIYTISHSNMPDDHVDFIHLDDFVRMKTNLNPVVIFRLMGFIPSLTIWMAAVLRIKVPSQIKNPLISIKK